LLTDKYLDGVPDDARMARGGTLPAARLTNAMRDTLQRLHAIARNQGRSLTHLALAWVLRDPRVTSAIIGARTRAQLDDCLDALTKPPLTADALTAIDAVLAQ
jgi:L-glyceraldehyde 3-phosphate reductase